MTTKIKNLPITADIDDFRDAIKDRFSDSHLKGIASSNLQVFKNKIVLEDQEAPLPSNMLLRGLHLKGDDVLLVLVPDFDYLTSSSTNVKHFWISASHLSATFEEAQGTLQLPRGVFILGHQLLGSSIYIRDCYPKLLNTCMSIINRPNTPHLVILGNPGIGKTFFGYYLLMYLASRGSTVIYESGKERSRYLFSRNCVCRGKLSDFKEYLQLAETFYIVDARRPDDAIAKTILLSDFCRDVWFKFSDDRCDIRYMPIWSREEIQHCRQLLFPYITAREADTLFNKWGGIPRYVLANAHIPQQQDKLDDAITSVDLDALVKCIGGSDAADFVSHRLVHIHVSDDFSTKTYRFASDYVLNGVYSNLFVKQRQQLLDFMAVNLDFDALSVLRGCLFEKHAHSPPR